MKKKILIIILSLAALFILIIATSLFVSFAIVKSTTDKISLELSHKFSKLVRIPKGLPPQTKNFYETIYYWEMETTQGEVVSVRFRYSTGFDKRETKFEASLELPENGDASIFTKVLPAVVADNKSLSSALDIKKADFSANSDANYSSFKLTIKPETQQTTKITWDLQKDLITKGQEGEYQKLYKIPTIILKPLYILQKVTLDLMAG